MLRQNTRKYEPVDARVLQMSREFLHEEVAEKPACKHESENADTLAEVPPTEHAEHFIRFRSRPNMQANKDLQGGESRCQHSCFSLTPGAI